MKNITKTNILTVACGAVTAGFAYVLQIRQMADFKTACSYLDPVSVDYLSFGVAIFLITEGFYRINKNSQQPFKSQITRIVRISIGCAILTLHIMQFLHK